MSTLSYRPIFALLDATALNDAARVIQAWKVSKAGEFCRSDLNWNYARGEANRGKLTRARDVALELVHVNAEDPRAHLF